jgi:hypothetical protein
MNTRVILFWAPRTLCILFALFLVIFSFDVFGRGQGFWETALAFLIHNIPSLILGLIIWLTWRHERVAAAIFGGVGILYIALTWGRFNWVAYLVISGSLFLIAVLYLLGWKYPVETAEDVTRRE